MSEYKVLINKGGRLDFNREAIAEYILDENMELKAVRFRNGKVQDMHGIHSAHRPTHPLLRTPESLKKTLHQFFLHSLNEQHVKA